MATIKTVGETRDLRSQPRVAMMSEVPESRDSLHPTMFVFVACSVVAVIMNYSLLNYGVYMFVRLSEGWSAGLTLHVAFLDSNIVP